MKPYVTPDDHFPHVDIPVALPGVEEIWRLRNWCRDNAKGAYIERTLETFRVESLVRFFFTEERDAILFKVFFG